MASLLHRGSNASTVPTEAEYESKHKDAVDNVRQVQTESSQGTSPPRNSKVEFEGAEILDEINGYEYTAYNWSTKKKWWILTVVALCQTSMNFVCLRVPSLNEPADR